METTNFWTCKIFWVHLTKFDLHSGLKPNGNSSQIWVCWGADRQQLLAHNSQWLRRALERAAKIMWLFAQAVICTGRWIEAYLGPPKVLWRGVWCPSPIGSGYCILVRSASGVRTLIGGCSWRKLTLFKMIWTKQTKHCKGDSSENWFFSEKADFILALVVLLLNVL